MGRIIFLLLLGIPVFTLPCAVTAADIVNIPMDHQINNGAGNAIVGSGTISFQPANPGAGEPDGWCKNSFTPTGYWGPDIDFVKAGYGPYVDVSDPNTAMDVDVRIYHEHEYNDAGMVLSLKDSSNRWRNFGYRPTGGLDSYLHNNNWTHRTYLLNDYARQAWDLGGSDPAFDPKKVVYMQWSASDWQNTGNDWSAAKKVVIHLLPPNYLGIIKGLPENSPVQVFFEPVSYTPTLGGAPANSYFYLEQDDRSAGIRAVNLTSAAMPVAGGFATFSGTLENDALTQEPYLAISALSASGSGNNVKPLGVNSRSINKDTKLVGALIGTSGTVRTLDTAAFQWFTIADGYTRGGAEVKTKVVIGTIAGDPVLEPQIVVGDSVRLTGVVSQNDPSTRVILLKSFEVLAGPTNPPPHSKFKAIVVNCNPHCPGYGNKLTTEVFGWADPHYLMPDIPG